MMDVVETAESAMKDKHATMEYAREFHLFVPAGIAMKHISTPAMAATVDAGAGIPIAMTQCRIYLVVSHGKYAFNRAHATERHPMCAMDGHVLWSFTMLKMDATAIAAVGILIVIMQI